MRLEPIVAEFERRRDPLSRAIASTVKAEIPAYAQLSGPGFDADLVDAINDHHRALVAYLRSGRPLVPADLEYVRRSAADRARIGLPIADYLRSLRLGQRRMWEELLAIAGPRSAAFVAEATRNFMDFVDFAAVVAAEAYVEEQQGLVAEADRVRRDLLEELLLGREPAPGPARSIARAAGLHWSARCLLVVAVIDSEDIDERGLRKASVVLERSVAERVRPLVVVRRHEIVIVRAVTKEPVGLTPSLRRALASLDRDGMKMSIGASTVQSTPATLPEAYAEANFALATARTRDRVLVLAEVRALEYLAMASGETARRLIPAPVHEFARDDAESGGVHAATLRAYARAGLNAKAAAIRLGIHPNTAHYRLNQIAEKTGCDLRDVDDLVDLMVAMQLAGAPDRPGPATARL